MTLTDACVDIGFSITRASTIVNSPLFQGEMKRMEADVGREFVEAEALRAGDSTREALSGSTEKAAATLKGALDDTSASVRITAAKDILDRTGYAKEDKIKATVFVEPSQALIDVVARIGKEKQVVEPADGKTD
jgi:hypothetical protein